MTKVISQLLQILQQLKTKAGEMLNVVLAGVFCGSPALWAGLSYTNQEINLNYRDAPPCRRGASLLQSRRNYSTG